MCFLPPDRAIRPMPRPRWLPRRGYPAIRDNCLHTPSRPRREHLPNGYSGREDPRAKQTRQSISSRHRNGRRHRSASIYRRFYRASHRCFGNRDASRTYREGNRLSMPPDPATQSSNRNRVRTLPSGTKPFRPRPTVPPHSVSMPPAVPKEHKEDAVSHRNKGRCPAKVRPCNTPRAHITG